MSNIFSVPGFRAHVLARVSEGTLPESVVDKLKLNLNDDGENEATQLLNKDYTRIRKESSGRKI